MCHTSCDALAEGLRMQKVLELILVCLTDAWQNEVESRMDLSICNRFQKFPQFTSHACSISHVANSAALL